MLLSELLKNNKCSILPNINKIHQDISCKNLVSVILGRPSILFPARLSLASAKSEVSEDFSVCVILLFGRKDFESFFNCLFWLSDEYSPKDVEVPLSLSKTSDKAATVRTMHNFKSNPSLNLILDFSFSTSHFASASEFSPSIHVVYTYNDL